MTQYQYHTWKLIVDNIVRIFKQCSVFPAYDRIILHYGVSFIKHFFSVSTIKDEIAEHLKCWLEKKAEKLTICVTHLNLHFEKFVQLKS
jgi:hypothetical protein